LFDRFFSYTFRGLLEIDSEFQFRCWKIEAMARFNTMSVAAAFCFLAFVCVQVAAQPLYAPEGAPEGAPILPPAGAPILEPVPSPYAPELSPGA